MVQAYSLQRSEPGQSSLLDAQTVLDAITSNGQTRIFLVSVGPDGFAYDPLTEADRTAPTRGRCARHGRTPEDVFGVAQGAAVAAHYRDCVATGSAIVYEEKLTHPEERWWQTNLTPIRDSGGRIVQILGIAVDVSERKQIEMRLSAAERQFESIVSNVPGVVYRRVLSPDGHISYPYVSKGAKRLLGIDVEEVRSNPELMITTIDPRDRGLFDRAIAHSVETLSSFELEVRNVTATGEERWTRSIAQTSRSAEGSIVWNGLILDVTDRKRAEAELRERENRLRDFAEAASEWFWETDAELRFTRVSDRYFKIFDVPVSRVLGKRRDELADTSQNPEQWREHLKLIAERRPFRDFVYSSRIAGCAVRSSKVSGRPVFDETGTFRGYRGTGTDLTAQLVAEERAAAASARLLGAVEGMSEGVAIFDARDALVLCNKRYREINPEIADLLKPGTTFEELLRAGLARGMFPEAGGDVEAWVQGRMANHGEVLGDFERRGPGGCWFRIREQRTPDGGTTVLVSDITEAKRRETALTMLAAAGQGSAEFFEDVVRSLATGLGYRWAAILRLAGDGKLASIAACDGDRILPAWACDIAGTPCERILEQAGFLAGPCGRGADCPQPLPGAPSASFAGDVVVNFAGQPIGMVLALDDQSDLKSPDRRDITALIATRVSLELQRRDAEQQLRRAKETAEIASRAKTEFLANVSHELRTPLNAIIGFSQMIGEEIRGPVGRPEYKEYSRDIHTSSLHLLQIINDILDVSKIEAGMLSLHEVEVDFATIVQSCCRLVGAKATASEIALTLDLPANLPTLRADERMLKQILLNLLSNALKFTPSGGAVAVRARPLQDGGISFAVEDNGIGIPAQDFDKVFRPFGQVESALNRKFEGTGLGLPLSKGLIDLHGGTIALESKVGCGTTVTVTLPKRRAAAG